MTDLLNAASLQELASVRVPPCLSLYQPTHRSRPDNKQDPIRFRNLVKELEASLVQGHSSADARELLQPLVALGDDVDFWNHTLDGLAVFRADGLFRTYRLQRPVTELAVVADSFHVKPLRRYLQSTDRYQVLQLSRGRFRLFEGARDTLYEIDPASVIPRTLADALGEERTDPHSSVTSHAGTGVGAGALHHGHGGRKDEVDGDAERFFRIVDRGVHEHHSKVTGLPLVLAALAEHHHLFRRVSHNPLLMEIGLAANTEALSLDRLREEAWKVVEPQMQSHERALTDVFHASRAQGLGSDDIADIAVASVQGRVATLLIDAERHIPGRFDSTTGEITLADLEQPEVDDLLDDLGELVQKLGGKVHVMSSAQMPGPSGIAATYRH